VTVAALAEAYEVPSDFFLVRNAVLEQSGINDDECARKAVSQIVGIIVQENGGLDALRNGKKLPANVENHISLAVALYCPAGSVDSIIQSVVASIRSVIQETA
jgi:hypothetical protein